MALKKLTEDVEIIQTLGDYPNTDNLLTPEQLKAKFDEAAKIIKAYLNTVLVPYINTLEDSDFGNATVVVSETGASLSNYTQSAMYFFTDAGDAPSGVNGWLRVIDGNSFRKQIWLRAGTPGSNDHPIYLRTYAVSTGWGEWFGIMTYRGGTMTGAINMGGNKIAGLGAPVDKLDAATKEYADYIAQEFAKNAFAQSLPLSGGRMSGAISMNNNAIADVPPPKNVGDAVNKYYADTKLSKEGGVMSGAIAMGGNRIAQLSAPQANLDAANKQYVDETVSGMAVAISDPNNDGRLVISYGGTIGQTLPTAEGVEF